jgi:asparagine synthase (glutamine-hydrolysing)
MCGIAGFAGFALPEPSARERLAAMCEAIAHRGPDSHGYFLAEGIAMGMRRLSIIDVHGGQQPISNEDGTVTVVFNGEIYNHHTLRRRLQAGGHRFRTRSDTEVLVHLYEDMGPDMARELHGMFAFSIWDAPRRRLLIARDRTGMKPLSYLQTPRGLIYCSELRSLIASRLQDLRVSDAAITQYLAFGYVPDPNSVFDGVRKLRPGHLLVWEPSGRCEVRRYWQPRAPDPSVTDTPELVEQLRSHLQSAVESHLESEVPLGAFLSGGLDSSTVVALMARHAPGRVRTFSIGFAEAEYDESVVARAVASQLGTDHTELIVKPNVEETFESIATMFDEPFGDSSAIPTFLVAELARRSVTVALSGDAGDELFGGYTRYIDALRQGSLPAPLDRLIATIGRWLPQGAYGRNRLIDLGRDRWGRYAAHMLHAVRPDEGGVASRHQPGGTRWLAEQFGDYLAEAISDDYAASMMRLDMLTYLPGDILTKVDRTSMAVSLEARVPLLDAALVEFALALPGRLRATPEGGKRLFRRAIRGLIPDFVLDGPKRGFALPLAPWFRAPLRHHIERLRDRGGELEPYVERAAVRRLVDEHLAHRRDHSPMLWRLMVLERWLLAFACGELSRPPRLPRVQSS